MYVVCPVVAQFSTPEASGQTCSLATDMVHSVPMASVGEDICFRQHMVLLWYLGGIRIPSISNRWPDNSLRVTAAVRKGAFGDWTRLVCISYQFYFVPGSPCVLAISDNYLVSGSQWCFSHNFEETERSECLKREPRFAFFCWFAAGKAMTDPVRSFCCVWFFWICLIMEELQFEYPSGHCT